MSATRTRPRELFDCTVGGTQESRTKQSFKDECDVNVVVRTHAQTGMWAHLNPRAPTYGDFTLAVGLQEAIDLVDLAQDNFNELPAEVRSACDNDPVILLRALADPSKAQVLVDLGLPLSEEATAAAAALAEAPAGATPPAEEGPPEPVSPSS